MFLCVNSVREIVWYYNLEFYLILSKKKETNKLVLTNNKQLLTQTNKRADEREKETNVVN